MTNRFRSQEIMSRKLYRIFIDGREKDNESLKMMEKKQEIDIKKTAQEAYKELNSKEKINISDVNKQTREKNGKKKNKKKLN